MKKLLFLSVSLLVSCWLVSCSLENDISGPTSGSIEDGRGSYDTMDGPVDEGNGSQIPNPEPGQITAGEWNDLENLDFWGGLFVRQEGEWNTYEATWKLYTRNSYCVVVEQQSHRLVDVTVTLSDGDGKELFTAVTDVNGTAHLFNGTTSSGPDDSLRVAFSCGDRTFERIVVASEKSDTIRFDVPEDIPVSSPEVIDLLFMVDATGSMGDELEYLKTEIADVIRTVKADNNSMLIRLSVNFYRDVDDEYVVRSFSFTEDVETVQEQIARQQADGGGDYPEAVHSALENAIEEHRWSTKAAARLLFLVLDAPPHREGEIPSHIVNLMETAAGQGIRIVPVASSGVDKETEFILRSFSILTNGTYIFLTDHSGIGNDHIEPTIGQYHVEYLNNLLVKVIRRYAGTLSR